ncbi:hypothetical protein DPMN_177594 [Dreissena polymorpha]|uniref:CCHC-type domain-containing protein n=1 Tax=Dreissena polymorpha TaxID=45954 RepID=A0A9D4ILS6_DREPO|nr:hypothetical protein DPMN_177594 [Dreissena polymorpha]
MLLLAARDLWLWSQWSFRGNKPYNSGGPSSASATGPGSCFACGEFSHFRRNCQYVSRGQNIHIHFWFLGQVAVPSERKRRH